MSWTSQRLTDAQDTAAFLLACLAISSLIALDATDKADGNDEVALMERSINEAALL